MECGTSINANAKFCQKCGAGVDWEGVAEIKTPVVLKDSSTVDVGVNANYNFSNPNESSNKPFIVSVLLAVVIFIGYSQSPAIRNLVNTNDEKTGAHTENASQGEASQVSTKTLEQWGKVLKRKSPDEVIAMIGRPRSSTKQNVPGTDVERWILFEYPNLVSNEYTGKAEDLTIAFSYGHAWTLKQASGEQLDIGY